MEIEELFDAQLGQTRAGCCKGCCGCEAADPNIKQCRH